VNSELRSAPKVVGSEVAMSKYRCLAKGEGFWRNVRRQMRIYGRENGWVEKRISPLAAHDRAVSGFGSK